MCHREATDNCDRIRTIIYTKDYIHEDDKNITHYIHTQSYITTSQQELQEEEI